MTSITQRQILHSVLLLVSLCFLAVSAIFAQETAGTAGELTERENKLIEQMSDLDPSASDYQAQLQKIGAELRDVQKQLRDVSNTSEKSAESASLPRVIPTASDTSFSDEQTIFSPFDGMDAATLRQLRSDLLSQLKHLNQTIQTLGPHDEALANSLKEQKEDLTSNLNELNAKLGISAADISPSAETPVSESADTQADPFAAAAVPTAPPAYDIEIPSTDPIDTGEAWYGSDNKYAKILKEIGELKKTQEATQKQLDEIMDELKTIETQLKLLSRQAVADK